MESFVECMLSCKTNNRKMGNYCRDSLYQRRCFNVCVNGKPFLTVCRAVYHRTDKIRREALTKKIFWRSIFSCLVAHSLTRIGLRKFIYFRLLHRQQTIFNGSEKLSGTTPIKLSLVASRGKSSNSMITKVVLGVALVLIEFSIITLSQNNSLSLSNETKIASEFKSTAADATTEFVGSKVETLESIAEYVTTELLEASAETSETLQSTTGTAELPRSTVETPESFKVSEESITTVLHSLTVKIPDKIAEHTTTEFRKIAEAITESTASTQAPFQLPENCSAYKVSLQLFLMPKFKLSALLKLLKDQPKALNASSIKKCCPLHQNYKYDYGRRSCANSTADFQVNAIQAKFYENCIEDEELNVTISVVIENNCRKYETICVRHADAYL